MSSLLSSKPTSSGNNGDAAEELDLLPILIIPGFMSSGLEIQESTLRPGWKGRRLWLNVGSLGLQSVQFGASPSVEEEPDALQTEYKSDWLKHMSLRHDFQSEREGIKVRCIPGLQGVDYLTPGAFTNMVSYVFGPVIKALVKGGYREGVNLDAMSYDWRLPPTQMEARDQYFSRTIERVERMYNENDETPVVILCHSLGCKAGHYFLNFCLDNKGQDWLDKYIHTYMPVGGAHLGAPKALRSVISGDKMGLDTFLSDPEGLAFGRSLGSGPWLFPTTLPPGAPSCLYYHPQGLLEVSVTSTINLENMLKDRRMVSKSKKFKLSLVYGKTIATTEYHVAEDDSIQFNEVFTFPTSPHNPVPENDKEKNLLQVLLLEPGVSLSKHKKRQTKDRSCCYRLCYWPCKALCVLSLFPFIIVKHILITSAEVVTRAVGGATILAASEPVDVFDAVKNDSESIEVPLYYDEDRSGGSCCCKAKQENPERIMLKMTWNLAAPSQAPSVAIKDTATKDPQFKEGRTDCPGLLKREGLDNILDMMHEVYDSDPVDPFGRSSTEVPPVKRVKAIYGINLPSEIGGVYCRRPAAMVSSSDNKYMPDQHAKLTKEAKEEGYLVKGGLLYETKKCLQADGRHTSGDGTVPYYSLAYVKTWKGDCQLEVSEIDKAEHREILADPRFHETVLAYVSSPKSSAAAVEDTN